MIKSISPIATISILLAGLTVHALAADTRAPVTKPPGVASPPTYAAPGEIGARTGGLPGGVRPGGMNATALTENGCVSMHGEINRDSKECNDKGLLSCKIIVGGMAQWLCIDNK